MILIILSFFSWVLTVLAPCVLPLLPIILAWSLEENNKKWPYIIIASLAVSMVLFSILLKATTIFIWVSQSFWAMFSGGLIVSLWIITIFPDLWKKVSYKLWFDKKSNETFSSSTTLSWNKKNILMWFSLWPVFTSCSPTYAIILAIILPASFLVWLLNLVAYALWLSTILLLIAIFWQKLVSKLKIVADPKSKFKKVLWIIFLIVWLAIFTWFDKKVETKLIEKWFVWLGAFEEKLLEKIDIEENNNSSNKYKTKLEKSNSLILKEKNMIKNYETAYFAWWCFWCIESIMEWQEWVIEAISGYIWWDKKTANYTDISSWKTFHRESVKVVYDPKIITYKQLLEIFLTQIDLTDEWWQFADRWYQYTTAIYYSDDIQKKIASDIIEKLEKSSKFDKKIATKIEETKDFFEAEEYHQDYSKKNSMRYELYKKWSWRAWYIDDNKNKYEEAFGNNIWYKEYSTELIKNNSSKNIVLFFHANWCSTCQAFEKKVLSEKIPEDILILKIDFDTENELRKKYNILTQTSFVLIDSNWNLLKRWIWSKWIEDIIKQVSETKTGDSKESKTYTDEELRLKLTPMQYKVVVEWWTEPPFNNEYWDNKADWIYVDVIDWTPLFSSLDKYDSGTGWPSFTRPIEEALLEEKEDNKLLNTRMEVKSKSWDAHLWHVFNDWPSDKWWLRYCINSAALKFISLNDLDKYWYWEYLKLFDKNKN